MKILDKLKRNLFTHRYFIKQLSVYFLTSFLILCTFLIIFDRIFESISNNYIFEKEKEWAEKTGNSIEEMMGDYSALLQDLAENMVVQEYFLTKEMDLNGQVMIEQTINDFVLFNKGYEDIHIISADSSRSISSGYLPNIYLYQNWGILYRMTREENINFIFSSRHRGISGEYSCLSVAVKVLSPEKNLLGFIILDVYKSRITALLNQANPSQGNINITDLNNYIIYSNSDRLDEGQIYLRPAAEEYSHHFSVPILENNYSFNFDIKNIYFKLLYRELGKMSFILLLISMIISILIASFFSSSLRRPIIKLIKAMKTVGTGDLNVQLDLRKRNDLHELETEFNLLVRRFKSLYEENLESERLMHQAQISTLQAQIKPHFLYNILATMRGMVYYSKPEEVAELITNLTKLLRNSFEFPSQLKSLDWHLSIVQCYVDIQNKRFSDKFKLTIESDEKCRSCLMLPLLIQPIIENSISHGLENKIGDCRISIQTWLEGSYLFIKIEDNGTGIDPETVKKINDGNSEFFQEHVGFGNVKKRLAYFYDEKCYISLKSKAGEGTTVEFKIQYLQEQ